MAKDPAFLFYPGDWLGGTMGMTFEEKGAYIELLMLQFNKGQFTESQARQLLGSDFNALWGTLKDKFLFNGSVYWNAKLLKETEKRKAYTQSRRDNRNSPKNAEYESHDMSHDSTKEQHTSSRMENENGNRTDNKNTNGKTHQTCIEIYHNWYLERFKMKPQIDGGDAKAMKLILDYLRKNTTSEEESIAIWAELFKRYDSWSKFYKQQTRLKQINTFLSNIILELKLKPDGNSSLNASVEDLFKGRNTSN